MQINKSKSYILPLFSEYIELGFIRDVYNTYLFLEGKENKYFVIQYKKLDTEEFKNYLEVLNQNELVEEIVENDYINVILRIPDSLREEYDYFVSGNFSKIAKKKHIIQFLQKNYGSSQFPIIERIKQVLYKDRALKEELEYSLDITLPEECELSSIPSKQSETLKL